MKKRFKFTAVCLIMLIVMLAGCSKNSPLIDFSKFQSGGQFCYPGVEWGSSAEETAAQVDALLEGTGFSAHREGTIGYVTEGVPFEGEEWRIEWQYNDDELWCISILTETTAKKADKLYEKLAKELEKLYGEAAKTEEKDIPFRESVTISSRTKRWYSEDDQTRLGVLRSHPEGNSKANVGVVLSMKRKNFVTTEGW